MPSEVTTGIFTLAGTLTGACGTLAVSLLTARAQRMLAVIARDHTLLDRQFAEHREYLLRLDRFMEATRALAAALPGNGADDVLDKLYGDYIGTWAPYFEGRGGPELAGPAGLLDALMAMDGAVVAYAVTVDGWWALRRQSADAAQIADLQEEFEPECVSLRNAVFEKRSEYRDRAMELIGRGHVSDRRRRR